MAQYQTSPQNSGVRKAAKITTILAAIFLGLGVVFLVLTYATEAKAPIPGIGNVNLLVGAAFVLIGVPSAIAAFVLWIVHAARK